MEMPKRATESLSICRDVILNILVNLPVKTLLRFRCVSKDWLHLIDDDPYFLKCYRARSHTRPGGLHLLPLPYSSTTSIISYAEGLVCLNNSVWNPSTRESIQLTPPGPRPHLLNQRYLLGFDAFTNKYKLVCCSTTLLDPPIGPPEFHVMTLGVNGDYSSSSSSSWKWNRIPFIPPQQLGPRFEILESISISNIIFSLARSCGMENSYGIIMFDVRHEHFGHIPLPCQSYSHKYPKHLIEIQGRLAVRDVNHVTRLWVLNNDEEIAPRWTKMEMEIAIDQHLTPLHFYPLGTFYTNELLYLLITKNAWFSINHLMFFCYDPETKNVRFVRNNTVEHDKDWFLPRIIKHVDTIVKLKHPSEMRRNSDNDVGVVKFKILPDWDSGVMYKSLTQETEIENRISFDHLKFQSSEKLEYELPAMAVTFRTNDFSLVRKYCFWMEELSFKEALIHGVVATCFWFLLSKECPLNIKECLASALQFILYIAPKPTNMPIAKGQGVDLAPAPRKIIDQACIDTLVVDALRLGDEEITRQVCEVIDFLVVWDLTDTVGTDIQCELVRLACSFPFSRDICVAISLLTLINRINSEIKDSVVMEKLVEAVLSDTEWLMNIIRVDDDAVFDDCLVHQLYKILECITRGKYDEELWEVLVGDIVPEILERDGGCTSRGDVERLKSAARIISNTINGASSLDQIEHLIASNRECVWMLVDFLELVVYDVDDEDDDDKRMRKEDTCLFMEAIEKILKCDGDESVNNRYATMIGNHIYEYVRYGERETVNGWDLLDNSAPNSGSLLLKYAPRNRPKEKGRCTLYECFCHICEFLNSENES